MNKIILFLLLLFFSKFSFAQYYVDIHYYIEQEDRFITVTDTIHTDSSREANELSFSLFLHSIADYDCDYLNILYKSKDEKATLMLPYSYRIYCDDGNIELMSRYTINRLLERLKNDYWGRTLCRLKGLSKKKKDKTHKETRKKRKIKSRPEESFTLLPLF